MAILSQMAITSDNVTLQIDGRHAYMISYIIIIISQMADLSQMAITPTTRPSR